jgi:hypothetical protein
MSGGSTRFTLSREWRDRNCVEKDTAMKPVYERLRIKHPGRFRAIIMPGMFGREAYYLRKRGVPADNLFAVEDNSIHAGVDVHLEIRTCRHPDRRSLRGMDTTPDPMEASRAVEFVCDRSPGRVWDLAYFDFMGQPSFNVNFESCLRTLLARRAFKRDASLILTFGRTRANHTVAEMNKYITRVTGDTLPTETYLKYLLFDTKYPKPFSVTSHHYVSLITTRRVPMHFVTTVLDMGIGA